MSSLPKHSLRIATMVDIEFLFHLTNRLGELYGQRCLSVVQDCDTYLECNRSTYVLVSRAFDLGIHMLSKLSVH